MVSQRKNVQCSSWIHAFISHQLFYPLARIGFPLALAQLPHHGSDGATSDMAARTQRSEPFLGDDVDTILAKIDVMDVCDDPPQPEATSSGSTTQPQPTTSALPLPQVPPTHMSVAPPVPLWPPTHHGEMVEVHAGCTNGQVWIKCGNVIYTQWSWTGHRPS